MAKSKYESYTKEQLLEKIKQLEKNRYGLVWEDKIEDVAEQCEQQLPVLHEVVSKDINSKDVIVNDNVHIIIEGDNYHALFSLSFTHKSKIDFIYIDPPYNTGAKDWKYNNSFVDEFDPYRHSKWLSFMKKRLKLAKTLLKPTGIICVTIDDYELPRLWCLLDQIFGEKNHLGTVIIRNNPKGRKTERKVSLIHEYALFYGRSEKAKIQKLEIAPEDKTHNYKQEEDGSWFLPVNLRKQGVDSLAVNKKGKLSDRYYPIYYDPKTGKISTKEKYEIKILPIDSNGEKRIWRRAKNAIEGMFKDGDLWYNETRNGDQLYYKFRGGLDGEPPISIWFDNMYSASEHGTKTLDTILGKREMFNYPKSPYAIIDCIRSATTNKNAVILDFFAGSGTTGQAVLEMNDEDGGNRQFILCTNNENKICEEVTYPRIKKVIEGYNGNKGIPANLKYFKTDFVPQVLTDNDKRVLVSRSTELLCLTENTFELAKNSKRKNEFAIYKSNKQYTAIIYDEDSIEKCKEELKKISPKTKTIIYVFSYDHEYNIEDFEDLTIRYDIKPIPEAILNVYRKNSKLKRK
jgi:adenine-specific DNA-methyltransferase